MFSFPRSLVLALFVLLSKLGLGLGFQPPPPPPPVVYWGKKTLLFSRMNGSTPKSLLKRKWGLRNWEVNETARADTLRDSESGFETLGPELPQESMALVRCKKDWAHQIGEVTAFDHSSRLLEGTIDCNGGCLKYNATDLCLNHIGNIASSERTLAITGTCFDYPAVLDAVENSTSLRTTSSCSLKDLGQLKFSCSSKNSCTTSPGKETEAMRKWKEIKQNGFLSHPNGGVPMPEPQPGKRSKRKKGTDQKRKMEVLKVEQENRKLETAKAKGEHDSWKMETAKGVQENRKMEMSRKGQGKRKIETVKGEQGNMLKSAPSSGLLSRISTGIIRRVKNREEVHAILEDMVRLENSDCQEQNEFIIHEESGGKESTYETNYQNQLFQYLNGASLPPYSDQKGKGAISELSEVRSYPEADLMKSRLSDYYKKLPGALTTTSNITTGKCDISLSVQHDLSRLCIPLKTEHGDISHDSDNVEESISHKTATDSQVFLNHDRKVPLTMITSPDSSARSCDM